MKNEVKWKLAARVSPPVPSVTAAGEAEEVKGRGFREKRVGCKNEQYNHQRIAHGKKKKSINKSEVTNLSKIMIWQWKSPSVLSACSSQPISVTQVQVPPWTNLLSYSLASAVPPPGPDRTGPSSASVPPLQSSVWVFCRPGRTEGQQICCNACGFRRVSGIDRLTLKASPPLNKKVDKQNSHSDVEQNHHGNQDGAVGLRGREKREKREGISIKDAHRRSFHT